MTSTGITGGFYVTCRDRQIITEMRQAVAKTDEFVNTDTAEPQRVIGFFKEPSVGI